MKLIIKSLKQIVKEEVKRALAEPEFASNWTQSPDRPSVQCRPLTYSGRYCKECVACKSQKGSADPVKCPADHRHLVAKADTTNLKAAVCSKKDDPKNMACVRRSTTGVEMICFGVNKCPAPYLKKRHLRGQEGVICSKGASLYKEIVDAIDNILNVNTQHPEYEYGDFRNQTRKWMKPLEQAIKRMPKKDPMGLKKFYAELKTWYGAGDQGEVLAKLPKEREERGIESIVSMLMTLKRNLTSNGKPKAAALLPKRPAEKQEIVGTYKIAGCEKCKTEPSKKCDQTKTKSTFSADSPVVKDMYGNPWKCGRAHSAKNIKLKAGGQIMVTTTPEGLVTIQRI